VTAITRLAWCAIAATSLGAGSLAPHQDFVAGGTAFVGVSVLPMSIDTLLPDQTVLVKDGLVTHIGPRSAVPVPDGTRIIRGDGRVLMPGLADMHVHLDDETDLRRYLEAGVTLVRNMRGEPRHLQWRDEIAAGRRQGPRIVSTGPTLTGAARVNPRHVSVTNAGEISNEVRAQAEAGYDLLKVHSGLSPRLLAMIGAVAESTHRALVGHLMDGGLGAALDAHQVSIEHVDPDAWTEGSIDDGMRKLAQTSTYLCPTFTTFYDADPLRQSPRHRAMLAAARRHKVELLAGTDAGLPSRHPGTTLVDELRYMAASGLPPYESLRTATVNAGSFALRHVPGIPSLGVVAVGSAADLILVPADPRLDLRVLSQVRGVMVAGRWLGLSDTPGPP
jgi:imidazolonepropionase-like amidohydrolase